MKTVSRYVAIAAVALLGLGGAGITARAQDATPAAGAMGSGGVTFQPIGFAEQVAVPNPADLLVIRLTLDPGAVSPFAADDPSGGLLLVESGTLTISVEKEWSISRGAAMEQAMSAPQADSDAAAITETIAIGQEATVSTGDVAYIPGSVAGQIRNDGPEPAVGLAFLIAPGGMISGSAAPSASPVP